MGEFTDCSHPQAVQIALVSVVFPAPRLPSNAMISGPSAPKGKSHTHVDLSYPRIASTTLEMSFSVVLRKAVVLNDVILGDEKRITLWELERQSDKPFLPS